MFDILEQMNQVDIGNTPNYKTMLAIGNHPEAYFPNPMETAARIVINVNDGFINDAELFNATVDTYVKLLSRMYDQLKRDMNPCVAERVFITMTSGPQLSLTCTFE